MICNFRIAKENVPKIVINKFGNREEIEGPLKFFLKDYNGNTLSNYYDGIAYLGNDHFAVATYDCKVIAFNKYRDGEIVESKLSAPNIALKWGIIKVYRDEFKLIIPFCEELIVPFIYDSIEPNNNNLATVTSKDKSTYIELDENKKNYSKQLFPCVFQEANNFDFIYGNFAEVRLDDKIGYIPRNINGSDPSTFSLLTDDEAIALSEYINEEANDLDFEIRYKYLSLTNETPALARILKKQREKSAYLLTKNPK